MSRLRPIAAFVLGSALLPACVGPAAKPQMIIKPVTEIRHAAGAGAAAYYERGAYYQTRGDLDLALGAYAQALTLDGRHVEARNAVATIYSQQGKFAKAESTLREVIAQNPGAAYLHNNLGYIHYLQGKHEAAITELRTAISLDPKNEWARNNLEMAQAALAARFDGPAKHAEIAPVQAADTAEGFQIWSDGERSDGNMKATASAASRTVPEIAKPIAPEIATPIMPVHTPVAVAAGEFRLEISNGNGMTGMAKRVSQLLGRQGIPVYRLTNQPPYRQVKTEIQYREGFQQQAEKLRESLQGYAVVARVVAPRRRVDIRVVLGQDIKTRMAELETGKKPTAVMLSKAGNE